MKHKLISKIITLSGTELSYFVRFDDGVRLGVEESAFNQLIIDKDYDIIISDEELEPSK